MTFVRMTSSSETSLTLLGLMSLLLELIEFDFRHLSAIHINDWILANFKLFFIQEQKISSREKFLGFTIIFFLRQSSDWNNSVDFPQLIPIC